jgi:hypothetical protein
MRNLAVREMFLYTVRNKCVNLLSLLTLRTADRQQICHEAENVIYNCGQATRGSPPA